MKRCPRCATIKPLDAFPPRTDRPSGSGRMSRCRDCDRAKAKAYYAAHRQQRAKYYRDKRQGRLVAG